MDSGIFIILGVFGLIILSGVIYMWEDFFGGKKKASKEGKAHVTAEQEKEIV